MYTISCDCNLNQLFRICNAAVQDLPERFMVWCRAGFQGTFLTAYTDIFYKLQTPENY